jgi:hypothetical protein
MDNPYWIIDGIIIFKPEFNESLDNYSNIISKCIGLIFSNYTDPKIAIETNNKYFHNYQDKYSKSLFNQPLQDSLQNLTQLKQLNLGYSFNQPLKDSLQNLTQLKQLNFGYCFNQQLTDSLQNLTQLEQLTLGYSFNQPLEIPWNIKYLILDCNIPNIIDYLSNNIQELTLGINFNLELNNLPNSIKKIIFNEQSRYNYKLDNLPNSLEYLELNKNYAHPIQKFPFNLSTIKCSSKYKYINNFNNIELHIC